MVDSGNVDSKGNRFVSAGKPDLKRKPDRDVYCIGGNSDFAAVRSDDFCFGMGNCELGLELQRRCRQIAGKADAGVIIGNGKGVTFLAAGDAPICRPSANL